MSARTSARIGENDETAVRRFTAISTTPKTANTRPRLTARGDISGTGPVNESPLFFRTSEGEAGRDYGAVSYGVDPNTVLGPLHSHALDQVAVRPSQPRRTWKGRSELRPPSDQGSWGLAVDHPPCHVLAGHEGIPEVAPVRRIPVIR